MAYASSGNAVAPSVVVVLVAFVMPVPVAERNGLLAVAAESSVVVEYLCASVRLVLTPKEAVSVN
jgi:hypothetical protein